MENGTFIDEFPIKTSIHGYLVKPDGTPLETNIDHENYYFLMDMNLPTPVCQGLC